MLELPAQTSLIELPVFPVADFPALKAHLKQTLTGPTILGNSVSTKIFIRERLVFVPILLQCRMLVPFSNHKLQACHRKA